MQAQREMFQSRAVLQALATQDESQLPYARRGAAQNELEALRAEVWRYLNGQIALDQVGVREQFYEIVGVWKRIRLALRSDPDVPLPE